MFRKKSSTRQRRPAVIKQDRQAVFSYYSQRPSTETQGNKRIKRTAPKTPGSRPWWHYAPSIMALIAIAVSLLYILGLSTNPKVLQSGGSGKELLRPTSTYQQAAQKQFKSSVLNLSKLTINTSAITDQLQSQFPELADVSIALPLVGRRPIVYVVPSLPAMILKAGPNNFVINQQGKAIMTLDQLTAVADQHLPIITDQSGLAIKVGQAALPSTYVSFVATVLGQLQAKKLMVDGLVLPAKSFELDVHISGQAYTIKMNLQNDATQQIGAFLAASQKLAQNNQAPASYFDVRVPGRVYYK